MIHRVCGYVGAGSSTTRTSRPTEVHPLFKTTSALLLRPAARHTCQYSSTPLIACRCRPVSSSRTLIASAHRCVIDVGSTRRKRPT